MRISELGTPAAFAGSDVARVRRAFASGIGGARARVAAVTSRTIARVTLLTGVPMLGGPYGTAALMPADVVAPPSRTATEGGTPVRAKGAR